MSIRDTINDAYFDWMYDKVHRRRFPSSISHRKLFTQLHNIPFRYYTFMDGARANEGVDLRYRFSYERPEFGDAERFIEGPCSVLEMIFALAIRMEEQIMDNPKLGDRTAHWFWMMLNNIGLGAMDDDHYDRREVDMLVDRFLDREYEPNGKGGLFVLKRCDKDLTTVDIWSQMCWFLGSIT